MKKTELDGFRRTLRNGRAELNGRYNREALMIEASPDELDRIQQAQERDFAIGVLDREAVRLRQIESALERIDGGSFGICLNCEEDIGAKRLAALPWAAFCIVCQEAADRMPSESQGEYAEPLLHAA
jgi:DnaK suppressor protein